MKPIIAIPITGLIVARAYRKKSLTTAGCIVATITALAHAYHPWPLPFVLLMVFFFAGTRVTHVKEDIKAGLTMASKGSSGGEGPRTHVQVLSNSLVASILTLLHANQLYARKARLENPHLPNPQGTLCYSWGGDLLLVGIIANYAAVAADTFSSELGILAKGSPRLITSWNLRKVPKGTNGGVTLTGLGAGLFGSMIVVTAATMFLPMCGESAPEQLGGGLPWLMSQKRTFMLGMVLWGALGSVLDSVLGGFFQRSVKDVRSGKIVEGEGGSRVLVSPSVGGSKIRAEVKEALGKSSSAQLDSPAVLTPAATPAAGNDTKYNPMDKHRRSSFGDERPSRIIESGRDLLDNNDVNFLMAVIMSVGAMAGAGWYWDVPIDNLLTA